MKEEIKELSKEDLLRIGIQNIIRDKFFIPHAGETILPKPYDMHDVYEKIYRAGYRDGVIRGEQDKIDEIKEVLNII